MNILYVRVCTLKADERADYCILSNGICCQLYQERKRTRQLQIKSEKNRQNGGNKVNTNANNMHVHMNNSSVDPFLTVYLYSLFLPCMISLPFVYGATAGR